MTSARTLSPTSMPRVGADHLSWLVAGGMVAAMLELAFAIAWWGPHGVPATRVLQGVAAWWIGRGAFAGGSPTALLGFLLYGLMMVAVALYARIARRWSGLLRRPLWFGAVYGAAVYVAVLEIAVPLLAAYPAGDGGLPWRIACLVAYILLVGIPAALFAGRASERAAGA